MPPPDTTPSTEEAVTRLIAFFETLAPAEVAALGAGLRAKFDPRGILNRGMMG